MNAAELYDPKCKKSIRLGNMKRTKVNAVSLYSAHTHQIFVGCSESGIERYDINKDRWDVVIKIVPFNVLKDISISGNPNVLIVGGILENNCEFRSFDLRNGQCRPQKLGIVHGIHSETSCVIHIGP